MGVRILLVDDSPEVLETMAALIAVGGHVLKKLFNRLQAAC